MAALDLDRRATRRPEIPEARQPAIARSQASLTTALRVCCAAAAVAALAFFVVKTQVALMLSIGAALAAVVMNHAVEALTRRGLGRRAGMLVVVGGLVAIMVGLGFLLIPPVVTQGQALMAELPALWKEIRQARIFVTLDSLFGLEEQLRRSTTNGSAAIAIQGILDVTAGLVALTFLAIFMLVFGRTMVAALLAEIGPDRRERYQRIVAKLYDSIGGYGGGVLAICSLNALLTTVFLAIMRMPFFLPLGILAGMSSLMPYAGPLVSGGAITLVALTTGGIWNALAVGIYFVLYGQLEGHVLAPLVYRRTVHVNPLVTLLAVLFLAELVGAIGAVIAVPIAAAAQIVVVEILARRREGQTRGALPPTPQLRSTHAC